MGWMAWSIRRLIDEQITAAIDAEIKGLSEQYAQGGIRRLVFVVEARTRVFSQEEQLETARGALATAARSQGMVHTEETVANTVTSADRPACSRCASAAFLHAIFTGTRCTTFTKLPDALSGGSSEKRAPVAGARLSTWPWNLKIGRASCRERV